MAQGVLDPDDLFGAIPKANAEEDLDDLFSSLPDVPDASAPAPPVYAREDGGNATQLFMEAIGDSPSGADADFDLFGASETSPQDDMEDLFAAQAPVATAPTANDELDDLFGAPLPEAPPASDEVDDLFSDLGDTSSPQPAASKAPSPGMVTSILAPQSATQTEEFLDLFGAAGSAIEPDQLFKPTGSTGTMQAVGPLMTPGEDLVLGSANLSASTPGQDFDDLFSDAPSSPPGMSPEEAPDDELNRLFADTPTSAGVPTGQYSMDEGDLEDLFAEAPAGQATDLFSEAVMETSFPSIPNPNDPGSAARGAPPEAPGLFDAAPTDEFEGDFSSMGFAVPGHANEDATIDISGSNLSLPPVSPAQNADDLDDLFGVAPSGPQELNMSVDLGVNDLGPAAPMDQAAHTVQELMQERPEENQPVLLGLEDGNILEEAHAVADTGGREPLPEEESSTSFSTEIIDEGGARPQTRRKKRRKPSFYPVPPTPSPLSRAAGMVGLLAASTLLAGAVSHHPMTDGLGLAVLAPSLALGSGLVYVATYAVAKIRLPLELLARGMALAAAGFAFLQVAPALLSSGGYAYGMILALGFGIGTLLESGLLYLSLRIALSILGVYSSLSLISGIARKAPYLELVTRRVLEAPGLAEQLSPDRLQLALKAFDPLFVAVNFFLPVVLAVSVLQGLSDGWKRWWTLALTRFLTAVIAGLAIYANLGMYRAQKVPNLLTLLGLS